MSTYDDLLTDIDAALESDGMRSAPEPEQRPEPEALVTQLTLEQAVLVELNRNDPAGHVAELVGAPTLERISFGLFDAMVADQSQANGRHNPANALLISRLLRAVVAGDVAAPDHVVDQLRQMIDTDTIPQLYGHAVLCGLPDQHNRPTGLPESVLAWLANRGRDNAIRRAVHAAIDAVLASDIGPDIEAAIASGDVGIVILGQ